MISLVSLPISAFWLEYILMPKFSVIKRQILGLQRQLFTSDVLSDKKPLFINLDS